MTGLPEVTHALCVFSSSLAYSRSTIFNGCDSVTRSSFLKSEKSCHYANSSLFCCYCCPICIRVSDRKEVGRKASKRTTKPGTVVLHQFSRKDYFWPRVITGSPPCLKLETFLRMAKLPYENDFSFTFSKKGKMPWIEFNGQEVADSNFCVRFLQKLENFKWMWIHIRAPPKEQLVTVLLEENTYW